MASWSRTRDRSAIQFLLILGVTLALPAAAFSSQRAGASGTERSLLDLALPPGPITMPPAELIRLDNPSRAAILHHDVQVRLDPATSRLEAADQITIIHATGVPATEPFPFLLWSGCEIQAVSNGGAALRYQVAERMNPRAFWKRPPYEELGGYEKARQVQVWLEPEQHVVKEGPRPAALSWPDTVQLTIRYAGMVYDSLRAPKVAYARSFESTAGLIEPRGAFLAGATFWVPSRPEEVFTFRCAAALPGDWHAVSQGALRRSDPRYAGEKAERIDLWDCSHPMEEIYLVAGPWTLHERDHQGVRVQTFTYADSDSELYTRYLDGTGRYLDLYGGRIGPYPFEKFALVENFWQTGFGMPSFTLLGSTVIRLPFILDTSYGHEILHNWWGNGVFVDPGEGNWCEGLTTYGADYLYKERESPSAARDYRLNTLVGYLDYVSGAEEFPLKSFRERSDFATQAVGYGKSMMVIHQLRRQAGDELFWASLRDFYKRSLWRRASWRDLLGSFHDVAGIEVEPFLHQWIERTGSPRIDLSGVRVTKEGKQWVVRAVLSQVLPDGSTQGEPFDVTVPIRLQWDDRDSTWQVPLKGWQESWSVRVNERPRRLLVDPDFEMLRRLHRAEIPPTLSRTLGSDTVTVVIAAGLAPDLEAAYRALAQEWAKGQNLQVLNEADLPDGWTPSRCAWYLGLGPQARRLVAGLPEVMAMGDPVRPSWSLGGKDFGDSVSVVITGNAPGGSDLSWSLIAAADPSRVATIGTKVPHYGKYSFLVFFGSKNIGQGVWSETASPLRVELGAASATRWRGME
jgi:aminopeptidase N